jgi:tetratricopeptide (TPR) repeat protein
MNGRRRAGITAAFTVAFIAFTAYSAAAQPPQTGNATAYTYAFAPDNRWTRTQDAYLPGEILFQDSPLNGPEDLFVQGNRLYVADTVSGRVVCRDLLTGDMKIYGSGILNMPTGVFVNDRQELYVADAGFSKVVVFNPDGDVMKEYGRPNDITFGKDAAFQPKKVAADKNGIVSIVSDGSFDGIIQLNDEGNFLGYFGYNTVPMTILEMLQDRFFTEAQKKQLFHKIPLTFYNIAQDSWGMNYTITQGVEQNAVKKHNISGSNLIKQPMKDEKNFTDIAIGPDGQIFAVTETGLIFEYDNSGNLLFTFGGRAIASERSGLMTIASGIAVDDQCHLYVLDKERGLVHTFVPTSFAVQLHSAINHYQNGNYEKSREELHSLLRLTGNVSMIYSYLGKNELQLHNYPEAAFYFKSAGDRHGYSEAFWEIRNQRINTFLPWVLLAAAGLGFLKWISRQRRKRRRAPPFSLQSAGNRIHDSLFYGLYILRHPFDGYYEVKTGRKGRVGTATLLYALAFLAFAFDYLGRGFAFGQHSVENTSPLYVLMLFSLPVALFIVCSYMVTEIHDGKGRFKTIYIAMAYALTPMICFLPVVTLLTHVLTLYESFLISFSLLVIYGWTAVLVLLAIREIHEYEFYQVFWNIVLTCFMMIIVIFVCSIIGMFWDKVMEIATSIGREVKYRAEI